MLECSLFFVVAAMIQYAATNYLFRLQVRIEKATDPLKRTAVVTLNDGGDPVRVELEDDTAWYARTRFGNYKAEVRELASVRGFQRVQTGAPAGQ